MDHPSLPDTDALDPLLPARPANPGPDGLRAELLAVTTRAVRRSRRWRQVRSLVAAAACLVAAAVVLRAVLGPNERPPVERDLQAGATAPPAVTQTPQPAEDAPAHVLEYGGPLARADKRAEVFRMAGDRYLKESNDVESALRCYRQALDLGGDAATEISPDDTWLLMALKDARKKEKRYVANDG